MWRGEPTTCEVQVNPIYRVLDCFLVWEPLGRDTRRLFKEVSALAQLSHLHGGETRARASEYVVVCFLEVRERGRRGGRHGGGAASGTSLIDR